MSIELSIQAWDKKSAQICKAQHERNLSPNLYKFVCIERYCTPSNSLVMNAEVKNATGNSVSGLDPGNSTSGDT